MTSGGPDDTSTGSSRDSVSLSAILLIGSLCARILYFCRPVLDVIACLDGIYICPLFCPLFPGDHFWPLLIWVYRLLCFWHYSWLCFNGMSEPGKRFRFANCNAHSVLNKRQEIEAMLSLYDLDMLCVTETWLAPDFVFEFFGYLTFRCDRRLGRGGGSLILIRSELAFTRLDLTIPYGDVFEAVGLSVRSPLGDLAVVCAYMPPNSRADLLAWRSLFAGVPSGSAILLCGDFNAHSGHWGSTLTNATGSRRFNIKNLDWPGFRSRCDELARFLQPRLELGDDPRSIYGDFLSDVSSALEACGAYRPSSLRGKRKAQPLWSNPQCDTAIARRRSAIKAYLCDQTRLGKA